MKNFFSLKQSKNNKSKYITTPALGIFKPNINSLISISNRIIGVVLVIIMIISLLIISKSYNINSILSNDIIDINIKKDNNFLISMNNAEIKINKIISLFLMQIILCLGLYHYFYSWIKVESNINNKQNLINKNVLKINKYYLLILVILVICVMSILWIMLNNIYIFNDIFYTIFLINSSSLILIYLIK